MPTHSDREDIHCIKDNVMTVLSDREINEGDEIVSPYQNSETHYAVFHVEEIIEKRRPMGEWKTEPPNLYKIGFRKEMLLWLKENDNHRNQ
jgi:hypothetical protein